MGLADVVTTAMQQELAAYEQALAAYRARDWQQATLLFQQLMSAYPDQPLYKIYLDRIAVLRTHPPADNWDGVFTLTEK